MTSRLLAVTDTPVIWTVTANSMVNVKRRDVCIFFYFFLYATRDKLTLYVVRFGSTVFGTYGTMRIILPGPIH